MAQTSTGGSLIQARGTMPPSAETIRFRTEARKDNKEQRTEGNSHRPLTLIDSLERVSWRFAPCLENVGALASDMPFQSAEEPMNRLEAVFNSYIQESRADIAEMRQWRVESQKR